MNANNTSPNNGELGRYRPSLSFFHPNAKCTGGAMKMNLHPAHDDTDGSIMVTIANQLTVGKRTAETHTFARFDWENAICCKLDFMDLCHILQVLRGECESIEDGRGLYHRSKSASTRIVLRHILECTQGYSFEMYRTAANGTESSAHIFLSATEALGLCEAISGSMSIISFGIPMLVAHEKYAKHEEAC